MDIEFKSSKVRYIILINIISGKFTLIELIHNDFVFENLTIFSNFQEKLYGFEKLYKTFEWFSKITVKMR